MKWAVFTILSLIVCRGTYALIVEDKTPTDKLSSLISVLIYAAIATWTYLQ